MTTDCQHYWKPVGKQGARWFKEHALARCIRPGCAAWTVIGIKEGIGPCTHVASRERSPVAEPLKTEFETCESCGALRTDPEECEWCGATS